MDAPSLQGRRVLPGSFFFSEENGSLFYPRSRRLDRSGISIHSSAGDAQVDVAPTRKGLRRKRSPSRKALFVIVTDGTIPLMKLPWILFVLLLTMCCVLGYVLTIEEMGAGHGVTHPRFSTMEVGGSGLERHAPILWWGWALGLLEICLFIGLLALGMRHRQVLGKRKWPLLLGGLLYGTVFTLLILSYQSYANSPFQPLFLSMPAPTAWMLYGLFGIPLYFHVLYVVSFDRWVLTPEDLERFHRLVAERRNGKDE